MPSIEDPLDDPWQGTWLKAATQVACEETVCSYRFLPLNEYENPNAKNLPTWTPFNYRRTLKLRLVFGSEPALEKVEVFSGSKQKPVQLRTELSAGETSSHQWKGRIRVYNGFLTDVTLWNGASGDSADPQHFQLAAGTAPKGLLVNLVAAEPSLPGSNDVSIVTLESGERTFSFAVPDVEKGPVYVPDFNAYVTFASDPSPFSPSIIKAGEKIREKLIAEPEQSYERASEELPPLDPVAREGDRLYLPLAADSSWQKFTFEWGGHVWIGKNETKAKGAELERLEWREDRIAWRIGTGAAPNFRPASRDSKLSVLEDYLPVATATWTTEGINYREEAFATLLSGPLSPDDAGRGEQTPAVLMLKLTAQNAGTIARASHAWLAIDPLEELELNEGFLVVKDHPLVRAYLRLPDSARVSVEDIPDGAKTLRGIHAEIELGPGEHESIFISLPFIPRLSANERGRLANLDYESERARVASYWRGITAQAVPFDVPEHRFVTFAKAVIAHIHIGVTKDPKSGLYMVPEASYTYQVFANGTAYHCAMLDVLGHHQLASRYLDPLVQLQGSVPLQGMFTGEQKEVYYGARVDSGRDYTHVSYGLDQGTVLWGLAEHYFFTRDRDWLRRVAPSMMRAADWIIEQRQLTKVLHGYEKVPEYGLLPPARLEDPDDWWHWFSVNAVAVQGLTRLAQALADIGRPEAERYAQQASAYRQDLRDDVLRASQLAPVVKLRDNTYVPYVPTRPYQRIRLFGPLRVGYYSRYPEKVLPFSVCLPLVRCSAGRYSCWIQVYSLLTSHSRAGS